MLKHTLQRINMAARDGANVVACYPGAPLHERKVFLEVVSQLFHSLQTQATAMNVFYTRSVLRQGKYLDMVRQAQVRRVKHESIRFPVKLVLTRDGNPMGKPMLQGVAGSVWLP